MGDRSEISPGAPSAAFLLDCRGTVLDARPGRALIMGVLNVTPDSFSDGGRYLEPRAAIDRAEAMLAEGAAVIDVGGASSRPRGRAYGQGAAAVDPDVEIGRVVPVIRDLLARRPDALVSVDTVHAAVARAALDAGAVMVNDVSGLRNDLRLADAVARAGAALVVMHSVGTPGDLVHEAPHGDVIPAVMASLGDCVLRATQAGVRSIVVDPGFGFGKTPRDNLAMVDRLDEFLELDRPILIGVSRKASVGIALGSEHAPAPVGERLFGSIGLAALAVARGASLVRTHDVGGTIQALRVVTAALAAGRGVRRGAG